MKKAQSAGIQAHYEKCRQETTQKIDDAYDYLKESHQKITKAALSLNSGISRKTLTKPYICEYLTRYPEFSQEESSEYGTTEEMATRIRVLEEQLSKSVNRNKALISELKKVKADSDIKYKQLQLDYEYLLGDYQKSFEEKTIRL